MASHTAKKAKNSEGALTGNQKVMQIVTDRICEQLKEGIIPWHKPWTGVRDGAYSRSTGRAYSLLNQMLLGKPGEYVTFKQCYEAGGTVREGEKSRIVVFWKPITRKSKGDDGEEKTNTYFLLRYYRVFHIDQCDGLEPKYKPGEMHPVEPDKEAEAIIQSYLSRTGCKLEHLRQNRACYSPGGDLISLPLPEQFHSTDYYNAVLFHEMGHSTGHESRLNREFGTAFGSHLYSREELVAELVSAGMLNTLGMDQSKAIQKNTAAYIQSWLKALQNDPAMIVKAASQATKALDLILDQEQAHADGLAPDDAIDADEKDEIPAADSTGTPPPVPAAAKFVYPPVIQRAAKAFAKSCQKEMKDNARLAGSFVLGGKQYITNGYIAASYEFPMDGLVVAPGDGVTPDVERFFRDFRIGDTANLPQLDVVTSVIADAKRKTGKATKAKFHHYTKIGSRIVNTEYLVTAMKLTGGVLNSCVTFHSGLFLQGEHCEVVVMGIKDGNCVAWNPFEDADAA